MRMLNKSSSGYSSSHNHTRRVLVLVGPTASGKTAISLLIAPCVNAEIISADSRQVYKQMSIGTAKPTMAQRKIVPHYFVDELLPDCDFNAGEFGIRGREIIDDIFSRGNVPFVVGGSGLYIRGLIDGFFEGPGGDDKIRKQLTRRLREEGAEKLLEELKRVDSVSASKMLHTNSKRIVRALEVYQQTGIPISELHKNTIEITFSPVFVGLQWERNRLYQRINNRVDRMIADGLLQEVEWLRNNGYSSKLNALLTTGYAEVFSYLEGKLQYEQMIERIKRNTRRYAKRQLTWFRYDTRIKWFDINTEEDFPGLAKSIEKYFLSQRDA